MTRSQLPTKYLWLLVGLLGWANSGWIATASAQVPARAPWYLHPRSMPPGVVGRNQLLTGMPLKGYYQPVEVRTPKGVEVSFAIEGKFERPRQSPKAALQIGHVYRLRVRQIPGFPESTVYPTIELINRLYPPAGQAWKFPVPIHLTQDDLELALQGKLVTRIIYIENPRQALGVQSQADRQASFDVDNDTDPLRAADRLGRAVAIVRLGSRTPTAGAPLAGFLFGSPPLLLPSEEEVNGQRQAFNITRTPAVRRNDVGVANSGQRIRR